MFTSTANRRDLLKLAGAAGITAASTIKAAFGQSNPISLSSSDDLMSLSAQSLSQAIKHKTISCMEVMNSYLDHIDTYNPTYNAIVSLQPRDALLQAAQKADDDLSKGNYRGWMHGFPHAVKDLAWTKGIPTTMGSPVLQNNVPKEDAVSVQRLKDAGAIIIGKTNTPEFGLGSQTYNPVFGTTKNAYDPNLTAGGSSGGAAAALATGMLPVADGSDMMGSLRNPAAYNNVIGFRPSQGLVAFAPKAEIFYQQLGYEGPMGRNVQDTALLLSTMAGYDRQAPLSYKSDTSIFTESLKANHQGKKIAWLGDFDGYLPMEQGLLSLCESALSGFEDIGCQVDSTNVDFPMEKLWDTWLTLRHFLMAGILKGLYQQEARRPLMKPEAIWEVEGGLKLSAMDVYDASKARSEWYKALHDLLDEYDFAVLPSAQVFPFDADIHWPKEINGQSMDTYHRWMEVVIPGTLSGCPVINVPVGFDERGRPMGIQIIGRDKSDLDVLKIAYAYEQASPWSTRTPNLVV